MLSKCANPECSEVLRYLHQGKIFHLSPTPELEAAALNPALYERFWLCDRCSKIMTIVWGGTEVELKLLPAATALTTPTPRPGTLRRRGRRRAASAGGDD